MRIGAVLSVVVCALVLSACASPDPLADSPYRDRIIAAQEAATSNLEVDVLADGEISRSEYEAAMQEFVTCMEEHGVSVALVDQAGYYVYDITDDVGWDEHSPGCREGTILLIEPLYVDMYTNPSAVAPDQALADCLVRHGVVPDTFTEDDATAIYSQEGGIESASDPSSEWHEYDLDPGTNPLVSGCLANANA